MVALAKQMTTLAGENFAMAGEQVAPAVRSRYLKDGLALALGLPRFCKEEMDLRDRLDRSR